MHRLVQTCAQYWMKTSGDKFDWEMRVLKLFVNSFPTGHFENWSKSAEFLPQAYQIMYRQQMRLPRKGTSFAENRIL
jgi:hypothetical protein